MSRFVSCTNENVAIKVKTQLNEVCARHELQLRSIGTDQQVRCVAAINRKIIPNMKATTAVVIIVRSNGMNHGLI